MKDLCLRIAPAKAADLAAVHSGWRSGLGICSQEVSAKLGEFRVAFVAEIAAVVEWAQCPTQPLSPKFLAFSRSREELCPSTNGHRLSSACWSLWTES